MIVVLGRPGLATDGEHRLTGRAARIALLARAAGGNVELVGSVGDDTAGDEVVTLLGRAGVRHAALLRDPGGRTPATGDAAAEAAHESSPPPRLDAADLSLGLSYLAECQVIVAADALDEAGLRVVADAAAYHEASLVAIVESGVSSALPLTNRTTLLEAPADDDSEAFDELTARYVVAIDAGQSEADAFRAVRQTPGVDRVSE